MKLWIDCEWTEREELISMALVDEDGEDCFYEVLPYSYTGAWQEKNVVPVLRKKSIDRALFTAKLANFLAQYPAIHIVADWPMDIAMFCNALIVGPGLRLDTPPLTMEVLRIDSVSKCPHNALDDAIAFRGACLGISS